MKTVLLLSEPILFKFIFLLEIYHSVPVCAIAQGVTSKTIFVASINYRVQSLLFEIFLSPPPEGLNLNSVLLYHLNIITTILNLLTLANQLKAKQI